ncbi:MAG TPA: tetratricopeptide repeat protein, partial [Candidatus Polarisedimenticolaceae bacterium]|nr:tetratricopeptide repeat protein [Candidatus Polarisedimenticolaceae bacterium]
SDGLPSSSQALMAMAFVRRRQGVFDESAAQMEKAAALDPRNPQIHFTLGETYAILRRYDDATRSLDLAVEYASDPSSAYMVASRVALLAGDVAEARRFRERSTQGGQGSSEVRGARFWVAVGCRDAAAALALADELPEAANAQFAFECRAAARGWALRLRGDEVAARAEFTRARGLLEGYLRVHPQEANVHSMLARVLAALGEHASALREARTALTLPPATTDAWLRMDRLLDLALVEIEVGRHDDAVAHLGELLAQPSDQVSVPLLRLSPLYDPLRNHPGFMRLVQ